MSANLTSASDVRLLPLGDAAWTVEFGSTIDPAIHARVLGLAEALEQARLISRGGEACGREFDGIVDVVPTFRSLTIHYDPLRTDAIRLGEALCALAAASGVKPAHGRRWGLPVCFDDEFAPDLADLAASKGMTTANVVQMMTTTEFQVYMIGFMPGFPYMGGLPPALHMPRLSSPRKAVPERSLAVAGEMCAVYPWESPGGWRLLGRTPVPMFSAREAASPALLASGDRVFWQAITRSEFIELEAAGRAGTLDRQQFLLGSESV